MFRVTVPAPGKQTTCVHFAGPAWLLRASLFGLRFRVWFRLQGSGFRVQGSGFRVQGSGFRV